MFSHRATILPQVGESGAVANIRRVPRPRIAAHLIIGSREEPFLEGLLSSIAGAVDTVIVDDNAAGDSPHAETLARSPFYRSNRLIVERSTFVDFATARNRCLRLHAAHDAGDWVAFIDADEIHGELLPRIASRLRRVPAHIDFIDGFTWHFFQSFEYYTSIERRMTFFRYASNLKWHGSVHEKLHGPRGARLALPYVYPHYGHTLPVRRHAEKGLQYSRLGAPGAVVNEAMLERLDPRDYFRNDYPLMLRFYGRHPPAALPAIARLRQEYANDYALTHRMVIQAQTPSRKIINALRQVNYEQRWMSRKLVPLARAMTAII